MSDNLLKREFKTRDVQRMRNIITKNTGDKTGVQVGYKADYVEHKEGDVWEERGKKWTIKNGIKQTGWRYLDKYIGGYNEGDLIVIAGRPGMGKTAIARRTGGFPAMVELLRP